MRTISQTGQFKRDLKREAKGPHRAALAKDFIAIVQALAKDEPLVEKHRDHPLSGRSRAGGFEVQFRSTSFGERNHLESQAQEELPKVLNFESLSALPGSKRRD